MALCLLVGMLPAWTVAPLLAAAATSTVGAPLPYYSLAIWHGFTLPLLMSLVALAGRNSVPAALPAVRPA